MDTDKNQTLSSCFVRALYGCVIVIGLIISMTVGSLQHPSVFRPVPYALGSVQSEDVLTQAQFECIAQDNDASQVSHG